MERNRSRDTGRTERSTGREERGGRDNGRSESRGESSRATGRSSSRDFQYHKSTPEDAKKRADQKGGADFDTIFMEGVKAFKVNDGDNCIRILPPTWSDPKHFGYDIFVHYGIGPDRQSYLCAKEMKTGDCPICEERARAIKNGEDDYAKELKPSKRVLVYLIDRDNEKEGVVAWSMPWTVDRDINSLIVDKRSGEVLGIDDPEHGYDIEFSRKGKVPKIEYIGMQIARRESDLGDDDWLQYAIDNPLPEQLKTYDYDYIAKVFDGGSGGKDANMDREQERGLKSTEERSTRASHQSDLTWDSVHSMVYEELCALIKDEKLDIKPDDTKDDEELADWICEDLKLSKKAERSRGAREPEDREENPREKLKSLRRREE